MNLKKLFFSILMRTTTFVSAQEEDKKRTSLGGYVQLDHFSFFKENEKQVNGRNQGSVQLEFASKLSDGHSFFFVCRIS